jgi:hypothetical protein
MTLRNAPLSGRDGGGYRSDLGRAASKKFGKTEIFFARGLDSRIAKQPVGQIGKQQQFMGRSSVDGN